MEFGGAGDDVSVLVECAASFSNGRVEIVDGLEVFVNERLVDERP
jgi:hypothetical protein